MITHKGNCIGICDGEHIIPVLCDKLISAESPLSRSSSAIIRYQSSELVCIFIAVLFRNTGKRFIKWLPVQPDVESQCHDEKQGRDTEEDSRRHSFGLIISIVGRCESDETHRLAR